jgi:hypothetical protein
MLTRKLREVARRAERAGLLTAGELEDREERLRARPRVPEARGNVAKAIENFVDEEPRETLEEKRVRFSRWVVEERRGPKQLYFLTYEEAREAWEAERGEDPSGNSPFTDDRGHRADLYVRRLGVLHLRRT